jgi:hypothetical protein
MMINWLFSSFVALQCGERVHVPFNLAIGSWTSTHILTSLSQDATVVPEDQAADINKDNPETEDSEVVKVETQVKTEGESGSQSNLAENQLELTDIGGTAGKSVRSCW